jgi:hypothetical protein
MKIENNSKWGWFRILYKNDSLDCFTKQNEVLKINLNKIGGQQSELSSYSFDELKHVSFILLNAYLDSFKEFEKLVGEKVSQNDLEYQQQLILLIRSVMDEIINFINNYDKQVIEPFLKL